jgi:hypothetical protein
LTFKDLKKRVSTETKTQQQSKLSGMLKNKPFWIWNIEKHKQEDIITDGDCCFNHIIGLPQKDGIDKPANPSFVRSLKLAVGDREDYENQIAYYKKMKWNWHNHMKVIPVSFNGEHKEMLGHAKMMLEKEIIAINPAFDKLITALRTAVAEEHYLDKDVTSYDDILDAYQLALKNYTFT